MNSTKHFLKLLALAVIANLGVLSAAQAKQNTKSLSYMHHSGMKETTESRLLFNYYKSYRANVRAKINALTAMESADGDLNLKNKNEAEKYLKLLKSYLKEF